MQASKAIPLAFFLCGLLQAVPDPLLLCCQLLSQEGVGKVPASSDFGGFAHRVESLYQLLKDRDRVVPSAAPVAYWEGPGCRDSNLGEEMVLRRSSQAQVRGRLAWLLERMKKPQTATLLQLDDADWVDWSELNAKIRQSVAHAQRHGGAVGGAEQWIWMAGPRSDIWAMIGAVGSALSLYEGLNHHPQHLLSYATGAILGGALGYSLGGFQRRWVLPPSYALGDFLVHGIQNHHRWYMGMGLQGKAIEFLYTPDRRGGPNRLEIYVHGGS